MIAVKVKIKIKGHALSSVSVVIKNTYSTIEPLEMLDIAIQLCFQELGDILQDAWAQNRHKIERDPNCVITREIPGSLAVVLLAARPEIIDGSYTSAVINDMCQQIEEQIFKKGQVNIPQNWR